MRPEKVFKRYDIRGEFPEEIDENFAERIGKALGTFASRNFSERVLVCRDNKDSSENLKKSLINGLKSTGVKVIDVGVGPTDYAAYTGEKHSCISVQVTSSHLPLEFNGFKFMYPEGNGLVNEDLNSLKDLFRDEEFVEGPGQIQDVASTSMTRYKSDLKTKARKYGSSQLDKTVAVDTLGGATNEVLQELLKSLGAEVIDLSEDKEDMPYRNPPDPKPEQLEELKQTVQKGEADLGIATDMDGDRITAYTDRFISGDEIFGILAQCIDGNTVASIDTSKAIKHLLEERGDEVFYTRVGDPFVLDKALEESVNFAGEPNGHYSILDFIPYNSGTLIGLILAGTDIGEALERLPDYGTERFNIRTEDKERDIEKIKETVEREYKIISEIDGVKFETDNCTVLVRPSGTSAKIRGIVESKNQEDLDKELEDIMEIVQNP